jgi:hypothetical protein
MNDLSEQNKMIQDQLNTMIQENERLKSADSLAGPKRAEAETTAAQAKDDRICNLMMKRKAHGTTQSCSWAGRKAL